MSDRDDPVTQPSSPGVFLVTGRLLSAAYYSQDQYMYSGLNSFSTRRLHRWVCAHVRHFHLLSTAVIVWVRVRVRVRFSLRAARVHTYHIYIHATCKRHV